MISFSDLADLIDASIKDLWPMDDHKKGKVYNGDKEYYEKKWELYKKQNKQLIRNHIIVGVVLVLIILLVVV